MSVQITEAESKIMQLLWESAPQTIMQMTRALKDSTGWDKHTVINLLKRMANRGSVRMEDVRPAKLYYPLVTREEAESHQTETFLGRVYDGDPVLMVSAMVHNGRLSKGEIDELMQMLAKAREDMD